MRSATSCSMPPSGMSKRFTSWGAVAANTSSKPVWSPAMTASISSTSLARFAASAAVRELPRAASFSVITARVSASFAPRAPRRIVKVSRSDSVGPSSGMLSTRVKSVPCVARSCPSCSATGTKPRESSTLSCAARRCAMIPQPTVTAKPVTLTANDTRTRVATAPRGFLAMGSGNLARG